MKVSYCVQWATGEALYTTNYVPERGDLMVRVTIIPAEAIVICLWAYLDGVHPSVASNAEDTTQGRLLAAFDWNGKNLSNDGVRQQSTRME